jgi:hypothetical protein
VRNAILSNQASRFPSLEIHFQDLGASYRGGMTNAVLQAEAAMMEVSGGAPFFVAPCDYIMDAGIVDSRRRAGLEEGELGEGGGGPDRFDDDI